MSLTVLRERHGSYPIYKLGDYEIKRPYNCFLANEMTVKNSQGSKEAKK